MVKARWLLEIMQSFWWSRSLLVFNVTWTGIIWLMVHYAATPHFLFVFLFCVLRSESSVLVYSCRLVVEYMIRKLPKSKDAYFVHFL